MTKIILKGMEILKIFDEIKYENCDLLFPKNKEIFDFLKNNKFSYYDEDGDYYHTLIYLPDAFDKNSVIIKNNTIIETTDIFEIEFPDNYSEEKLFYFCLKYEGEIIDV